MRKIASLLFAAAFIAVLVVTASGCSLMTSTIRFTYKGASNYTAGGCEVTDVKDIDVDWVSGSIEIVTNSGDTVVVSETTNKEIEDELKVHCWLDGGTLRIRFCKSGIKTGSRFSGVEKKLTVSVPESISIGKLEIDDVSANLTASGVNVGTVGIDSVSGDITLDLPSKTVKVDTVSGDIGIKAFDDADYDIDTVSGDTTIDISACSGIKIVFDTVSGTISGSAEFRIDGKKYINGDGSATFDINSVSGDIKV